MKKFIFILIVAFILLLAFYSSQKKEIINSSKLKSYVEIFNKSDNELYTQHIPNENAFEFLNKNIPLIDLPNKNLEETYYFRWWTFRKHIKSTVDGFVITEFLPQVSWAPNQQKFLQLAIDLNYNLPLHYHINSLFVYQTDNLYGLLYILL